MPTWLPTTTQGWCFSRQMELLGQIISTATTVTGTERPTPTLPPRVPCQRPFRISGGWFGSSVRRQSSCWLDWKRGPELNATRYAGRARFVLEYCCTTDLGAFLQYWPARGTENYGVMSVTLTDTQELATYVIRTFQLQRVSSVNVSSTYHNTFLFLSNHLSTLLEV